MAKVFGGGNNSSGGCAPGSGGILPSQPQRVTPARSVTSSPNVFRGETKSAGSIDLRDFYTKRDIDTYLDLKADLSDVYLKSDLYTKTEVDSLISGLNLSTYALRSYVDSEITDATSAINLDVSTKYYQKTVLYTKSEVDTLISSVSTNADYISKSPSTVGDVTITPGNTTLSVSLLVKSSNNSATTEVQRWENSSTDHLASIFADGGAMISGYMSVGENTNTDAAALNTNERRIEGVADPINNLDAVNKTYMERFITTTIDDVLTDSDENYLIDALEY